MKINKDIFKAYDIRGKFPAEIDEMVAERLGRASAIFFSKSKRRAPVILVCRDLRESSPVLKDALVRGLLFQGANVVDVGEGTTPYFYFLMHTKPLDGGIMITASHSPVPYNGFKIRKEGGGAVAENTGLKTIKRITFRKKLPQPKKVGSILTPEDHRREYINFLTKDISIGEIRGVIDAGSGSTTIFLPEILSRFPNFTYKPLFFEPDGSFKMHSPSPLDDTSQKYVKKELSGGGFQFGAIFDGDGDRVIFFDEKGSLVKPEVIAGIIALEELKKSGRIRCVFTLNTSRGVREYLRECGGDIKLSSTGYVFMQQVMKKNNALLGVETSGHMYFKKFFFDDSALMATLKLAQILSHTPKPLSQLAKPFDRYISSGELNFKVQNKKTPLKKIKSYYKKSGGKIKLMDGVLVEFTDWWFNVRRSNTEPVLRLVLEAKNKKLFDEKMEEVKNLIR